MGDEVNTEKDVKSNFLMGYGMLPAIKQPEVRQKIMFKCGWNSVVTFYDKCRGRTKIRKPEVAVIEKIFSQYNLNPWTGEYLY